VNCRPVSRSAGISAKETCGPALKSKTPIAPGPVRANHQSKSEARAPRARCQPALAIFSPCGTGSEPASRAEKCRARNAGGIFGEAAPIFPCGPSVLTGRTVVRFCVCRVGGIGDSERPSRAPDQALKTDNSGHEWKRAMNPATMAAAAPAGCLLSQNSVIGGNRPAQTMTSRGVCPATQITPYDLARLRPRIALTSPRCSRLSSMSP